MRQVWPLLVSSLAMMLPVNPAPAIMKSFMVLYYTIWLWSDNKIYCNGQGNRQVGDKSMDKATIINHLIKSKKYKSYLEIGIQIRINWDQIDCDKKVGVEPFYITGDKRIKKVISDKFFASNKEKFDVIFIDGDHHEDAVYRDIKNSLLCLEDGGTIVLHDAFPPDLEHTQAYHCGTVYRAIWKARLEGGLSVLTYSGDFGVCLMKKSDEPAIQCAVGDYRNYMDNAELIINVKTSESSFMEAFESW